MKIKYKYHYVKRSHKKKRIRLALVGLAAILLLLLIVFFVCKIFFNEPSKPKAPVQINEITLESPTKESYDIIIDPGHGGRDPGCEWGDIYEKDIDLNLSLKINEQLKDLGYNVYMTREEDTHFDDIEDYDLIKRVEIGEQHQPKLFLSIHVNFSEYSDPHGLETIYNGSKQFAAYSADKIAKEIENSKVIASRGASETFDHSPVYIVDYNPCETVLIETGFLSNEEDRSILTDEKKLEQMAEAICEGIHQSFTTYSNE